MKVSFQSHILRLQWGSMASIEKMDNEITLKVLEVETKLTFFLPLRNFKNLKSSLTVIGNTLFRCLSAMSPSYVAIYSFNIIVDPDGGACRCVDVKCLQQSSSLKRETPLSNYYAVVGGCQ